MLFAYLNNFHGTILANEHDILFHFVQFVIEDIGNIQSKCKHRQFKSNKKISLN